MKKLFFILLSFVFMLGSAYAQSYTTTYSENNKFGLVKDEEVITPAIYTKLIRLKDKSFLCLYKNKYGIIDNNGVYLVEPKYSQAQRLAGRFAKLGLRGLYAIYNEEGVEIASREYSTIELLYGRMFLIEKNYKYGLISFDGDIILAPVADDIYMPKPNIIKILYEGEWYEVEQKSKDEINLPYDILSLDENQKDFEIKQIVHNPITSAGLGVVSASDYFIKVFSSISPAYEQTIDELILNHGADTATILMKSSWLVKFPFVYSKNYLNNIKAPNNGPLSDVKTNLKNKMKRSTAE